MAYSVGTSEPIRLSHNHYEHHQAAFADILVNSHQLKLESEPIGEGTVPVTPTTLYNLKGAIFIGEYGVVYGAVLQRNGNQEAVAVKTVKGALTMLHTTTFTMKLG